MLTSQNMHLDRSKSIGLTMEADIVFNSSYGQVHDVLTNFLGFTEPSLHVACGLRLVQDWHRPLWVPSFQLTGVFTDAKPKPLCDKLQLTSIGARLIGYHTVKPNQEGNLVDGRAFGYAFFGTVHLTVPGSSVPLEMAFEIEETAGSVSLQATLDGEWEHAFGVLQLTVSPCFAQRNTVT